MLTNVSFDATAVARRRADRAASRAASKRVSARRSIEVEPTLPDAQAEQVEEGLLRCPKGVEAAPAGLGAAIRARHPGPTTAKRRCCWTRDATSGNSTWCSR